MKKKKSTFTIAIAVVLVVVVPGVVSGIMIYNNNKGNSYVATVAGEKVTESEFKFFLGLVKNDYEKTAGVDIKDETAKKDFWKTKLEGVNAEVKAKNDTLEQLKEFKILLIKAKENKVALDAKDLADIRTSIDQIVTQQGNGNKSAANVEIKKKYGISLSDYEAIYKNYMLAYGKYAKEESGKIPVTDKESKDYYEKNKSKFGDYQVKHILIMTKDAATGAALPEGTITERKKLAEEVYNKVNAGENFDTLVTQYSEDPTSKDKGGILIVAKDDTSLNQGIRDWASSAKAGEIKKIDTDYGFHILKFVKNIAYDDVKDDVKVDFQSDAMTKKVDGWKKEEKFNIVKNQKVLDSIKVI